MTGKQLNKKWDVGALHSLYDKHGAWYHNLKRFPGALFDADGYVLFETEADYTQCLQLRIKEHTHCIKGISTIPNYVKMCSEVQSGGIEGEQTRRIAYIVKRVIRDTKLSKNVKQLHGDQCQLCGLVLSLSNGESYSEAHHIKPLGSVHAGPDSKDNLLCVCPNCHVLLDYGAIEIRKDHLRLRPEHSINDKYIDYHNTEIFKG